MKSIYRFVNPSCFFTFLLIQNFLVKSTNTIYICTSAFIPALFYILLRFHKLPKIKWLTCKMLFFGMVLGLFDFINLYLLFKFMENSSTFIILSCTAFAVIYFIGPDTFPENMPSLITCAFVFFVFKAVLFYEIYGHEDFLWYAKETISQGEPAFSFVFVMCIFRIILERNVFDESEREEMKGLGLFFLIMYSGLYIFIDMPNTTKEGIFAAENLVLVLISVLSTVIWLLTCKEFTAERAINYTSVCFIIQLIYFIIPWFKGFNVTRVEDSLYFVYLSLYICLISLFLFVRARKFLPEERWGILENLNTNSDGVGDSTNIEVEPNAVPGLYAVYTP